MEEIIKLEMALALETLFMLRILQMRILLCLKNLILEKISKFITLALERATLF
jgi:hypothetical protein